MFLYFFWTFHCQVVWIKGHGRKRIIVLKNDMKGMVYRQVSFRKVMHIIGFNQPQCDHLNHRLKQKPVQFMSNVCSVVRNSRMLSYVWSFFCFDTVKGSSSAPGSPLIGEGTETPRDSPISNDTAGAQSPGQCWLILNLFFSQDHDDALCWNVSNTVVFIFLPGDDAAAESELLSLSPVDLLCGPVPSCLPSPQLHPDPVLLQEANLIHLGRKTPPTGWFWS